MAEKWHAPAVPADAEEVLSKVPTTKPANPGRVAAGKKVSQTKSLRMWGKKEPKTARCPCWRKRKVRERKRRSQQLFASWNWRSGCLRSGSLLSTRGDYDHLRRTPAHAAKMLRLRQNQSQSPTQPQSSVNGLKFFHIIYLQPCQTTSWSKVLSALQCFTVCGELLRHCPTTNQTIFWWSVSPYQRYFYPPRGDVPGKEYFFNINIYGVWQQARQNRFRCCNAYRLDRRHRLGCEENRQRKLHCRPQQQYEELR